MVNHTKVNGTVQISTTKESLAPIKPETNYKYLDMIRAPLPDPIQSMESYWHIHTLRTRQVHNIIQ